MEQLVTVVIPVYNVEAYLDRCVRSVTGQTYRHLEIILVDDGSTDGCPALCDQWAARDDRVRVIHKENAGAGYARNSGLDRACGEYLLFVDSDDYIASDTVALCVTEAELTKADMVLFGRNNVAPDGTEKPLPVTGEKFLFEGDTVREELLPGLFCYERGFGVSVWGKLFRRKLIEDNKIRFPSEREIFSEDACFLLETFAYVSRVALLRDNLYFYNCTEGSLSRTLQTDYRLRNDAFLRRGRALCVRFGYPPRVASCLYARYRIYALAGLKLVLTAPLDKAERRRLWQDMLHAPLLREGVTEAHLREDTPSQRLLWRLYRMHMYGVCRLLLLYKTR